MKYSYDTFRFYKSEKTFSYIIRGRIMMKDPVDKDVLDAAVNTAITRYPYCAVRVGVDEDGAYVLSPNPEKIAVLDVGRNCPLLGSPEVNGHLVFLECQGKEINFYRAMPCAAAEGSSPL